MSRMEIISVLCVLPDSNYLRVEGLDLWNKKRDACKYDDSTRVICHPPCAQWSRLRHFSRVDMMEKELAVFCLEQVHKNGGILEHPVGSLFWKEQNLKRSKMFKVFQSDWGFPAQKATILYCHEVELLPGRLSWELPKSSVAKLHSSSRSRQTLSFCKYLVESVRMS